MPRRALTTTTLVARVRAHFGLDQAALALYLGVSPTLVQYLESGARRLTIPLLLALQPLARHLPAALEAAAPEASAAPPGLPTPEAADLDLRRRECLAQAARLARQLARLAAQGQVATHWAAALPALLAAAEAAATDPTRPADPDRAAWLVGWLRRQARPLPPETATRWHRLRARRAALLAEAEALRISLQNE